MGKCDAGMRETKADRQTILLPSRLALSVPESRRFPPATQGSRTFTAGRDYVPPPKNRIWLYYYRFVTCESRAMQPDYSCTLAKGFMWHAY
jgi:hypothetical protein